MDAPHARFGPARRGTQGAAAGGHSLRRPRSDPRRPTCHTGVVRQGVPSAAIPEPVLRILVSLSTWHSPDSAECFRTSSIIVPWAVEATVTVGPGIDASRLRVPQSASMHAWLDHDEVLATTSPAVGHGGRQHGDASAVLRSVAGRHAREPDDRPEGRRRSARARRCGRAAAETRQAETHSGRGRIVVERPGIPRCGRPAWRSDLRQRNGADVGADAIEEFLRSQQLVES